MCKTCRKSIDHLFLHCKVATKLWSAFLLLFGVAWIIHCKVSEFLGSWRQMSNHMLVQIWKMAPLCLM
jgi:hypothetical protein